MAGNGCLTLSGNNAYTGGTWVYAGTLQLGSDDALGNPCSLLAVQEGGVLDLNGHSLKALWLGGDGGLITDNSSMPGTSTLTLDLSADNPFGDAYTHTQITAAGRPVNWPLSRWATARCF